MTVTHISRRDQTWFLHVKTTATGKAAYFFSMDTTGSLVESVPDGYEIYENINSQVFLRKKTDQLILPKELALVETALRKQGNPWQFQAEVKKNTMVVYGSGDMHGLGELAKQFRGRSLSAAEHFRHANYMAVLRFTLADKQSRAFVTERFCFRGSVDDWIYLAGPAPLASQVSKFVKHLGKESFYELF